MKKTLFIFLLIISVTVSAQTNFYSYTVTSIDGTVYSFSQLKGKKVLIVNTASKCGFTPQYEDLEKVYQKYKDNNLVIIGFPANNFMHQEPGSNDEIKSFCTKNYGVSFPMMEKISVKGADIAPLYKWLTTKEGNKKANAPVKWNFQKFLIDESGNWVGYLAPSIKPFDSKLIDWIEGRGFKE